MLTDEGITPRVVNKITPRGTFAEVIGAQSSTLPGGGLVEREYDIFTAAQYDRLDILQELVEEGADIFHRDELGHTALHWAALSCSKDVANYLLNLGMDANVMNSNEYQTPLQWAVIKGHYPMVKLLISYGASPLLCDNQGCNALHCAAQYGQTYLLHYLISPTHAAKRDGGAVVSQKTSLDLDAVDNKGHTAVHWAAYQGHFGSVRYLIEMGANPRAADVSGYTPLHWAVINNQSKMTEYLLKQGVNPFEKDAQGSSPVMLAQERGLHDLAMLMKEGYANSMMLMFEKLWVTMAPREAKLCAAAIVCTPLLFFLLSVMPFLSSIWLYIAFIIVWQCCFQSFWQKYLSRRPKCPFHVCLVSSFYVVTVLAYFSEAAYLRVWLLLFTGKWFIVSMFLFAAVITLPILYYKVVTSDPGRIEFKPDHLQYVLDELEQGHTPDAYCQRCEVRQPIRSKHCTICRMCVPRFDHHSLWINNCVGWKNHDLFILLLIHVACSQFVFLTLTAKIVLEKAPAIGELNAADFFLNLYSNSSFLFWVGMAHVAIFISILFVIFWHVRNIVRNVTTHEMVNFWRCRYLFDEASQAKQNPFDLGLKLNVQEFLAGSRSMVDYSQVYSTTSPLGKRCEGHLLP
eukprot:GFYU01001358.1.p1 GENE.GFYU01001358.1~~GFYU01001358.1.p1  ORF type:complete len:629 (+),score=96.86 GFYU01001358.1:183-2069(+)